MEEIRIIHADKFTERLFKAKTYVKTGNVSGYVIITINKFLKLRDIEVISYHSALSEQETETIIKDAIYSNWRAVLEDIVFFLFGEEEDVL